MGYQILPAVFTASMAGFASTISIGSLQDQISLLIVTLIRIPSKTWERVK